jgi:hypothetical protein
MKSLAVSKLRQEFDRCAPEVHLNVSHTGTDTEFRRADAFVESVSDIVDQFVHL